MSPTMYPYLSYRDAATALHFLEEAFGFTVSVRWDDSPSTVQHAEAALGDGAMMLGTAEHPTAPLEDTSVGQGIYVYVEDVDAHFERARVGEGRHEALVVAYSHGLVQWDRHTGMLRGVVLR